MRLFIKASLALVAASSVPDISQAQSLTPFGVWRDPLTQSRPGPHRAPIEDRDATGQGEYFGTPMNRPAPRALWTPAEPAQPMVAAGGARPEIAPVAPELVTFKSNYEAGVLIVDTGDRKLFRVNGDGTAYAYPIGVGREGFSWQGEEQVSRIAEWPDWYPPAERRQRRPELPEKMLGGVLNPLGARAIYLGNTLYRIHGTDAPKTVGRAESSGCIRMLNEHVVHLASLVKIGDRVIVTPDLDPNVVVAQSPFSVVR